MTPGKVLITTADDFGYGPELNAAVVRAYREGILRYASLMVDRPGAEEAVRLSRENPGLGVGLHLELCADSPALWGLRYAFSPGHRARIDGEIRRQIDKFLGFGLKPTHIDGHFNIHVHPIIFPRLAEQARRYGIPRVRLPAGELGASLSFQGDKPPLVERLALAGAFGALGRALAPLSKGLLTPRAFGLLHSGLMKEDYLVWLLERLPEGVSEVYFHPSSDPRSAVAARPTATHHTYSELEALLSARARAALGASGARLAAESGAPPFAGAVRT